MDQPKKPSGVTTPRALAKLARALIKNHGVLTAAGLTGVSRTSILTIAAGGTVRRGTLLVFESKLASLDSAASGGA